MLRTTFFFLLSLSDLFSFSQVNIINHSLIDSSLNIAYIGVENSIELIGHKGSNKLSFSTTNGTLMDLVQNRYVLKPLKEGECVLTFKEKEKLIAQKTFKAEIITGPFPRFSSQYDSIGKDGYAYYISFNNLIKDPVFRAEPPNCYFKQPYKIVSYRMTLDSLSGGTITEFSVSGSKPTEEQIQIIRKYGVNTFMTIDEIKCTDLDGRTRKLTPSIYIVTN